MRNTNATMKILENQVAQMAKTIVEWLQGSFPINTEVNPKEPLKVVTLRSGKELLSPVSKEPEVEVVVPQPRAKQAAEDSSNTKVDRSEKTTEKG